MARKISVREGKRLLFLASFPELAIKGVIEMEDTGACPKGQGLSEEHLRLAERTDVQKHAKDRDLGCFSGSASPLRASTVLCKARSGP